MERIGSVAKAAKKKIDKILNPLSVIFKKPDENVEFAAWHRVGFIKCDTSINDYNKLVEKFYSFEFNKQNPHSKNEFFKEGKFIHINNSKTRELFGKIVDDLKNGNAIKRRRNIRQKKEFIINYDYINHEEINNKDVKETDNKIIDDSTINKIKENRETIEWFNFKNRYENHIDRFNEEYGCNIVQSTTNEAQDEAGGQDAGAAQEGGGYNKYLKNKKKSKRKKNKVKKGGVGSHTGYSPMGMGYSPVPLGYSPVPPGYSPVPPGYSPMGMGYSPVPLGYQMATVMPSQLPWMATGMPVQNSPEQQDQSEKYEKGGIDKHTEVILIIKNDSKKKIEFYRPIDITKEDRLTRILKGISNKEKKESKKKLEENVEKLQPLERGYLAQFGGSFDGAFFNKAVSYTPIPLLSVETVYVINGLMDLKKGHFNERSDDNIVITNNNDRSDSSSDNPPPPTHEEKEIFDYIKDHVKNAQINGDNPELLSDQLDLTTKKNIIHFN